jgi:hypothetical protein
MRVVGRRATIVAAVAGAACFELSGPPASLLAISTIRPAWPSVVVGDVLRDADGAEAPLRIEVFDSEGQPVTDATVSYVALDRGLRVDANGVVHGDSARTSPARVVAQVRRVNDVIQTPEVGIDVVPLPDSVNPRADTTFAAKPIPVTDPAPISSDPLNVTVLSKGVGNTATPVRSWIVTFEIVSQPAGEGGQNTAVFVGGGAERTSVDTTDANGLASRTISLQRLLLAGGTGRQDVTVRATIRRIGAAAQTRTILFTLPFGG